MSIKKIVASVSGQEAHNVAVKTGVALAERLKARLVCVHIVPDYERYLDEGLRITRDELERFRDYRIRHAEPARRKTLAIANEAGVDVEWLSRQGATKMVLLDESVAADLLIVEQGEASNAAALVPHTLAGELAMTCAKPVVVTPATLTCPTVGSRILVAWNGARESLRAVVDSLPLLRAADHVEVLYVKSNDMVPGVELEMHGRIEEYLSNHGVKAQCHIVGLEEQGAGSQLLSKAKNIEADLVVMGAFGHRRLFELMYGGATAYILDHAQVPVFLSH